MSIPDPSPAASDPVSALNRSQSGPLPVLGTPPLPPRSLRLVWAACLCFGVLGLAAALPLDWRLPNETIYPFGATIRVVSGLLALLALIQISRPGRTSVLARRAILVSAFLLAGALALLLVGSGPAAPRPDDGGPGAPEGVGLVIPFVLAALSGAAWGATRGIRSVARRGAWSFGCRDWDRAAWLIPLTLGLSSLATGTLCVLGLALEAPLSPSSFPVFTLGASLVHGVAAALLAQALASSLRDQAQLRGEPVPLFARLAPKGRAFGVALAIVIAPTVALEGARLAYHLQSSPYERVARVTDVFELPSPPVNSDPFRGPIATQGKIAEPGAGGRLEPDHANQRLLWSLNLTRAGERLASVEQELSASHSLSSGELRGLQIHTRRALGAPTYHLSVQTWLEESSTDGEGLRFTTWVAVSSGPGEPRLRGALLSEAWPDSTGLSLSGSERRLRLEGYSAILPLRPRAPAAPQGLRWVFRWDGRLTLERSLGEAAPAPGKVTILSAADDYSYHLVSEQELRAEDATGVRSELKRESRVRRIPWRGGVW